LVKKIVEEKNKVDKKLSICEEVDEVEQNMAKLKGSCEEQAKIQLEK
jgi:hypothetical protein